MGSISSRQGSGLFPRSSSVNSISNYSEMFVQVGAEPEKTFFFDFLLADAHSGHFPSFLAKQLS
jgi:hypothetical protein